MKPSDAAILVKLEDIENMLVAQQVSINESFDKLEKLIVRDNVLVSPELEQAIKMVAVRAVSIDEKVPE